MKPRTKRTQQSNSKVLKELSPIPLTVTPPKDPPSVRRNATRTVTLDFNWLVVDEAKVYTLTSDWVRQKILDMYGLSVSKCSFLLEHIHAWSPAVADSWILLRDERNGINMFDSGSLAVRGRVGLYYPKNAQTVHPPQSSEPICTIGTAKGDATGRVRVRFWDALPG